VDVGVWLQTVRTYPAWPCGNWPALRGRSFHRRLVRGRCRAPLRRDSRSPRTRLYRGSTEVLECCNHLRRRVPELKSRLVRLRCDRCEELTNSPPHADVPFGRRRLIQIAGRAAATLSSAASAGRPRQIAGNSASKDIWTTSGSSRLREMYLRADAPEGFAQHAGHLASGPWHRCDAAIAASILLDSHSRRDLKMTRQQGGLTADVAMTASSRLTCTP
jgi:hypothetical protein